MGGQSFCCGPQAGARLCDTQAEDGMMWLRSGFFAEGCMPGRDATAAARSSSSSRSLACATACAAAASLPRRSSPGFFAGALRASLVCSLAHMGAGVAHFSRRGCREGGLSLPCADSSCCPPWAPSSPLEVRAERVFRSRSRGVPAWPSCGLPRRGGRGSRLLEALLKPH